MDRVHARPRFDRGLNGRHYVFVLPPFTLMKGL